MGFGREELISRPLLYSKIVRFVSFGASVLDGGNGYR